MKWVILGELSMSEGKLFGRIDEDGLMRVTAIEEHPELQAWLAEGNTPETIEDVTTDETS
jgi:hypothetical protein